MLRKLAIALAATAFMGAMVVADTADARMGGGGFGGMHGGFGGMHGGFGGMRGFGCAGMHSAFVGSGFRGVRTAGFVGHGVRGPFFRPGFRRAFFFHNHRRLVAAPFFVGAAVGAGWPYFYSDYYSDPCWVTTWTAWGPRTVYTCTEY